MPVYVWLQIWVEVWIQGPALKSSFRAVSHETEVLCSVLVLIGSAV